MIFCTSFSYYRFTVLTFFALVLTACSSKKENETENKIYDIVILNARVIDPETKTDAILSVGINADTIACISKEKLSGKQVIEANGDVLSPGFIDLHAHGQTNVENEYQAFDGVTTALELEVGIDTLDKYLAQRKGNAILNFGASACQLAIRNKIIRGTKDSSPDIFDELSDSSAFLPLPLNKFPELHKQLKEALAKGAIGVGVPVGYLPHASIEEIAEVYNFAGQQDVPVFSHIREGGSIAFQQAICDAVLNNTQLHICHINSMARKDITFCLSLVAKAQKREFPITTEFYPYTAANTEIASAVFDDGWKDRLGCDYGDLQWVETNERLTEESFNRYRKTGGSVIIHMMKENWIEQAMKSKVTMIASDGATYSTFGHPRSSGTFCRVLAKYVRDLHIITLAEAIEKMTLMPARVLEHVAPDMKKRGRIQVGCYADLSLFDPKTIQDKANYQHGFTKSFGIKYLFINGKILIKDGKKVENCFPGVGIKGKYYSEK